MWPPKLHRRKSGGWLHEDIAPFSDPNEVRYHNTNCGTEGVVDFSELECDL